MVRFIAAAHAELALRRGLLRVPLQSIFVGGGTPTALGAQRLSRLLTPLRELAGPDTEFTVEANPITLDDAALDAMLRSGVSRVSVGVQSLCDSELAVLGRAHRSADALTAIGLVRDAGLRASADLIYGIDGQTADSWRRSLDGVLATGLEHLSAYALTFEPHTPLGEALAAGTAREMDDDLQRELYELAIHRAAAAGLEHYELSNFAAPAAQCRHNLTYWHNMPYVGIGPGAASYVGGVREVTAADLDAYLAGKRLSSSREQLTGRALAAETAMLGLRLIDGLSRAQFADRFGCDIAEAFPRSIARHASTGALVVTPDRVRLASNVLFASNEVLADIIAEGQD
jgi:oxygen-independent coproporphyrinogen-3 oxidase